MGIDVDFGMAYIKSQLAAGQLIPKEGTVFMSVRADDKESVIPVAKAIHRLGYKIVGTSGTADTLDAAGIPCSRVIKVYEGRPNIVDQMKNGEVQLVINTPSGKHPLKDEMIIRQEAYRLNIPVITTMAGAKATANALKPFLAEKLLVNSIQSYMDKRD